MPTPPRNFNPEPYAYHEEVELRIDTLTNLGIGLGRIDGWVVMVAFALPGERIRARVFRNRSNYSEADLVAVLESSPERVEPGCPLFGTCGGCQYQHLAYPAQLRWKTQQVAEVLERIGGLTPEVQPARASPRAYHYRSKLTPHYQAPRGGELGDIGFLRHGQRQRIVDVPHCPIATEGINDALPEARERLRDWARRPSKKKKRGGTVLLREALEGVTSQHDQIVTAEVDGLRLRFKAGDFFQNNPFILPELLAHVRTQASEGAPRFLIDAYCGGGLFALGCAGGFERCAGVEISEGAVEQARENARLNGIANCTFMAASAEAIFAQIDFPPAETALVIDPPRRGCDPAFLEQVLAFAPARIVYVSCDPATQARDLKHLTTNGFSITQVQPFDLFPHTRHIENVATLTRA